MITPPFLCLCKEVENSNIWQTCIISIVLRFNKTLLAICKTCLLGGLVDKKPFNSRWEKRASRCYFRGMDPQVRTFCIITIFETMFTVGSKKKQEHLYFQAACTLLKTGKELIVHWQLCNCYSVRYVSFTNENYNTTNTCQYN